MIAEKKLVVVGLGPGDPGMLTIAGKKALEEADEVWVRTRKHPTLDHINFGDKLKSFDEIYDTFDSLDEVYRAIAERLRDRILAADISYLAYAVPGSPSAGERSVKLLRESLRDAPVNLKILPSVSALEAIMIELGLDPIDDGLQLVDASELEWLYELYPSTKSQYLNPTIPLLVTGIWNQSLASVTKLFLLSVYPPEWPIKVVRASVDSSHHELQLVDLDKNAKVDHLASVYVPPLAPDSPGSHFYQLTYITARLRGPGGCPWDREQNHYSIKRYLLEEAYEVIDALDKQDIDALEEELGDLLLQISLHSEIAYSESEFEIGDVIRFLTSKLIRRHPHVFGDIQVENASHVTRNWQMIKKSERSQKGEEEVSVLDGVPRALPALARAQSISVRAAKTGFEWDDARQLWEKVLEELEEVKDSAADELPMELGDLLFVLVNWARFHGIDAEESLRIATDKFEQRFREMERRARSQGKELEQLSIDEMDALWEEIKEQEKNVKLEA